MERAKRLELDQADPQPALAAIAYDNGPSLCAAGSAHGETNEEIPAPPCDSMRPEASTGPGSVFEHAVPTAEEKEQLNQIASAWHNLNPELRSAVLAICRPHHSGRDGAA